MSAMAPMLNEAARQAAEPYTPTPGKQTLVEAEHGTPAVDEEIDDAVGKLLQLGVREARLGDVTKLGEIRASIPRALTLLEWIKQGGGNRGAKNRIISAWNAGQDGLDNPKRWPTILHYVRFLDRLARESMGMGYDDAIRSMPKVRLAGAGVGGRFPIHPRAIYFCAAAQVGMDVRAGREEGQGHYVPVAGFKSLLRDLKRTLTTIAGTNRKQKKKGKTLAVKPIAGATPAVIVAKAELERMIDALAAQQAGEAHGEYQPDEHLEPDLAKKLVPLRDSIATVGDPSNDVEAAAVAARLLGFLGDALPNIVEDVDGKHGSGSVDPHGPGHAMGLAVDMFYGAGDGKYGHQNKGVKKAAWPFIHALIERHGPTFGLASNLRPRSMGALSTDDGRALSKLLNHEVARDFRDDLIAEAAEVPKEQAAADRKTYRAFHRLRQRASRNLFDRKDALERALGRVRVDAELRAEINDEIDQLLADAGMVLRTDPVTLSITLANHLTRLQAIEIRLDLATEKRTPEVDGVTTRKGVTSSKILTLLGEIEAVREAVGPVLERRLRDEAVESARDPYTRWLLDRAAQDDRPLFDQPTIMVDALEDVHSRDADHAGGSPFQGSHHWVVAPMKILETQKGYFDSLRADMEFRQRQDPPQLERVLAVMAESEGGRTILGTPEPREGSIQTFHLALAESVGGVVDAAAMIGRVHKRVVEPYEDGTQGAALRDRGFYEDPSARPEPAGDELGEEVE